jgi:hypothetical protein
MISQLCQYRISNKIERIDDMIVIGAQISFKPGTPNHPKPERIKPRVAPKVKTIPITLIVPVFNPIGVKSQDLFRSKGQAGPLFCGGLGET